jgi:aspartokinase
MSEQVIGSATPERDAQPIFVDKIGGAGSKDVESMLVNVDRVADNDAIAALVVSGPGGPAGRVTNLAISGVNAFRLGQDHRQPFAEIAARLIAHAEPLGKQAVSLATGATEDMKQGLLDGRGSGWVTMGPERYQAGLYVYLLGEAGIQATYLDPTAWVRRDTQGAIDLGKSAGFLSRRLDPSGLTVSPGTPGVDESLRVVPVTPSLRGYTDVTGMVVAAAYQQVADRPVVYRIIKDDVSGILRMPPGISRDPEFAPALAPALSIVEAETLGVAGNGVVHPTVLELLQQSNITLKVGSGRTGENGTVISRKRNPAGLETIVGIALQEVVAFAFDDISMEHRSGVLADIATTFEGLDVPILDMITGKGTVKAYTTKLNHDEVGAELADTFTEKYGNRIRVQGVEAGSGLTIVTVVGEAMATDSSLLASVISDVTHSGNAVGIATIDFWPSPNRNAIYVVVPTDAAKRFAVAIYDQFFDASP